MRSFQKGEKARLTELTPTEEVSVGVQLEAGTGTADISCFGVDAQGKLSDDRYFIFYNQKSSPEGAIAAQGPAGEDRESFAVRLAALPETINRLVFTATLDGEGTMATVTRGHLRLSGGPQEVARYSFTGADFAGEKAVILGELYRKDGWRFAAVGQGFNGGLSALLAHFGGSEIGTGVPAATPTAPPPTTLPPPPAPEATPAVNLSKVTLEKKGAARSVNLTKGGGTQPLHFNLNWSANVEGGRKRGFLSGRANAPDLDLGCMFELVTGEKSVIQPLGGYYGDARNKPWIWLDKDDRSGQDVDGENLFVYRPDQVRRILLFALIYDGAPDFKSVGATLTITDAHGGVTVVHLDNPDANRTFCAICTVTNSGSTLEIRKEEQYFRGAHEADGYFQFGFQWKAGQK
jgi:tellurite resistance protein TerA